MDTLQPGGINNVVFEIAKGLSKKGNNNIIVFNPSWDNNSNMVKIIFIDNFKLVKGYKYKNLLYGFDIKNVEIVKNILNFFNPNIIHLHGIHTLFSPEMIYIIKKYYANIPVVFSPHLDATRSTFAGNHLW
ncbi:MAG: glycosyltransferase, partial [Nitrososphaeria archaeon]|nr:glycosyltransferase [Nitrososphaeria archaeon]